MVELRRTVRFAVNSGPDRPSPNSFAGSPAIAGLGRHYEIEIACRGPADPRSGYLIDIKRIDDAVRSEAQPLLREAVAHGLRDPRTLMPDLFSALSHALPAPVRSVTLRLTPYHSLAMDRSVPSKVLIRQRFDFAAAHRLHVPALSDEENQRLFGKCNNPNGHGHNYQLEPCVEIPVGSPGQPPALTLDDLERTVQSVLIDRFDHKHLNADTTEFASPGGLNPTVENIARVFFSLLEPAIASRFPPSRLRSITVWENDRTSATYPG